MSDEKFCQSSVSDNDLILVRWQDEQDGGWREGVVMCVHGPSCCVTDTALMREAVCGRMGESILYDRHRHERAIVPLSKVQIVEPRCDADCDADCDACGGSGQNCVSKCEYRTAIRPHKMVKTTNMEPCLVCHGSGKLETFQ